jgi:hypothetical protein
MMSGLTPEQLKAVQEENNQGSDQSQGSIQDMAKEFMGSGLMPWQQGQGGGGGLQGDLMNGIGDLASGDIGGLAGDVAQGVGHAVESIPVVGDIAKGIGSLFSSKDCNCWDGYKRVPGTKPCAPGSCEKCDSHNKKEASQGDQPSPNAAKAVLHALEAGDNDTAKELLGHTDCPEECVVHAEGKCNHGFMSAGRTRVRFLVDNGSDAPESNEIKEAGVLDVVKNLGKRLLKMVTENKCPVCNGTGMIKSINCPACDSSGDARIFQQKAGQFTEEQLPQIVDSVRNSIGIPTIEEDPDWEKEFGFDPFEEEQPEPFYDDLDF